MLTSEVEGTPALKFCVVIDIGKIVFTIFYVGN